MNTSSTANTVATNESQSPFACNLLALSREQRKRHAEVTKEMISAAQHLQELLDGYAFQFAAQTELLNLLAEFVSLERLCCPFFAFAIKVEPEGGAFWLHITGREGAKDFLQAELDLSSLASA